MRMRRAILRLTGVNVKRGNERSVLLEGASGGEGGWPARTRRGVGENLRVCEFI